MTETIGKPVSKKMIVLASLVGLCIAASPAQWFTQPVDHFDPLINATWLQKYYVVRLFLQVILCAESWLL